MLGYCSNSPLRCENARSLKVLHQIDGCCPECHLYLIPIQDISQQLRADELFLRWIFLAVVVMLFLAIYIYYLNFV